MSYERWSERSRDRRGRYLSMTWASPTAFEPDIVSSRFFCSLYKWFEFDSY